MFVEMHSHIIYGVDDGAQTREDMFALLRQAASQNVKHIVCTPHIFPGYQKFSRELFSAHFYEAEAWCNENAPDMKLYMGAEVFYTASASRLLDEGYVPTLNGTRVVLLEFSPNASEKEICYGIQDIASHGYSVILAHVERYVHLHSLERLRKIKQQYGCNYQMNSSAVSHKNGGLFYRHWIRKLLDGELIDLVSSDAHWANGRPFLLEEAYETLRKTVGTEKAASLCGGFAEAVLKIE